MNDTQDAFPDYEFLKSLMLEISHERQSGVLLERVVSRLVERDYVALARVYLIAEGDLCEQCPMSSGCLQREKCLHIEASAGNFRTRKDWPELRRYKRLPLGWGRIGGVALSGEARGFNKILEDPTWTEQVDWIRSEEVEALSVIPIRYEEELLGVLAIFLRVPTRAEGRRWLQGIADQMGAAIINARAFEQIEQLREQLSQENRKLRKELSGESSDAQMIGTSLPMVRLREQIRQVAPTDASVLVLGESGSGKELVARAVHRASTRRDGPLIKVNCAAIPAELYESEFFGHVQGAFTGAVRDRAGRFEAADGGTLFLDEVGEIPLALQTKLLRVLQEGTFERVGEEETRHADVRIVAATNRSLADEVAAGRFRQDLYYRLDVFPIEVEPLRNRKADIATLARHFFDLASRKFRKNVLLSEESLAELGTYDWPGNIRELQNVIERALITCQGAHLRFDLPGKGTDMKETVRALNAENRPAKRFLTEEELNDFMRQNLIEALTACDWQLGGKGGAAEKLGLKTSTLASRVKKLGIKKPPS